MEYFLKTLMNMYNLSSTLFTFQNTIKYWESSLNQQAHTSIYVG